MSAKAATAVRHKASTRARVIELYKAGWMPAEIQRVLAREDIAVPSRNTIWVWTHPRQAGQQAKRDLEKTRRWRTERASFAWPGVRGPEWKRARMLAMRRSGMSYVDIARVMTLDFPKTPTSEGQVRHTIRGSETPILGCCARCNGTLRRYLGDKGRPRKYCETCTDGKTTAGAAP
ncbi:MAG TPA: hypothetical protein VMY78_02545 [Solirubrobacteraceae bacterium]|nr:hypothetical protein [Solirubrobacteraceae bacterium]